MLGMGQDGFQAAYVRLDQALIRLDLKIKAKAAQLEERPAAELTASSRSDEVVLASTGLEAEVLALKERQAELETALASARECLGLAAEQVRMVLIAEKEVPPHG
jgi:hypothetical protein